MVNKKLAEEGCTCIKIFNVVSESCFFMKPTTFVKRDTKLRTKSTQTLEQVQIDPESFYSGELAIYIARDVERVNGNVTEDDLRNYKSIIRKPSPRVKSRV